MNNVHCKEAGALSIGPRRLTTIARLNMNVFCLTVFQNVQKEYFQALNNMKPFSKISYEICIISAVFPHCIYVKYCLYF